MAEPVPEQVPKPTDAECSVVLVPLILDAFVLNERLCGSERSSKIAPLNRPDYSGLGHGTFLRADIFPKVDLHTASPATVNSRVSDISTGQIRKDRLGIYLHWVLPKAFRSGLAATETASAEHQKRRFQHGYPAVEEGQEPQPTEMPEFRPVPDRWLVFRFIAEAVKADGKEASDTEVPPINAFAIESNRIRKLDDFGLEEDVETQAAAFLDISEAAQDQDDVLMGYKSPLSTWTDGRGIENVRYNSPLTVVDSSNPLLPDFQLHNPNVFSMHDDMTFALPGGERSTLRSARVSYFVFGYYADKLQDPFTMDPKARPSGHDRAAIPSHSAILEACFMQLHKNGAFEKSWLDDSAHETRLACHAARYNVEWNRDEVPASVPAESIAKSFESLHPVAVGVDTMDALEAYLDVHKDDTKPSLVHSLATVLSPQHGDIHAQRQAAKDLYRNRFLPSSGGAFWHFSKNRENVVPSGVDRKVVSSSGKSDLTKSPEPKRPSGLEVELLNGLNETQTLLEAQMRHSEQLRFLLFCEWWKERAEWLSEDEIGDAASQKKRLDSIQSNVTSLVGQLKRLGAYPAVGTTAGGGSIDVLSRQKQLIAGHPSLKSNLKQGVHSPFYTRKDPSAVLIGVKSPWHTDSDTGKLPVRLTSQLPLLASGIMKTTTEQTISPQKPAVSPPSGDMATAVTSLPNAWPLPPAVFVDVLNKASKGTLGLRDIPTAWPGKARRLITGWQHIMSFAAKAPQELQKPLIQLLHEWAFLEFFEYTDLDQSLPRTYLDVGASNKPANAPTECSTTAPDTRLDWNATQAWFPLFIEWEAEYFHIPFEQWVLRKESDGTMIYCLADDQELSSTKGVHDDKRSVSGRSLILPEVSNTLKTQLQELLKHGSYNDSSHQSDAQKAAITQQLSQLPFVSAKLEGLTDHLVTLARGTHVSPHTQSKHESRTPGQAIFSDDIISTLQDATTDVSPYGTYLDYQYHRRGGKDRAFSPFKPTTHGQVRFSKLNIVDKFGQVVSALDTRNGNEVIPTYPYTSKSVACQRVSKDGLYLANTVGQDPEGLCQFFQLPPAINQDARLNACFVVEDDVNLRWGSNKWSSEWAQKALKSIKNEKTVSAWKPTMEWESPIWAWLIINFRDGGLQVFDKYGQFVAEALLRNEKVYWLPKNAVNFARPVNIEDNAEDRGGLEDDETTGSQAIPKTPSTKLDYFLQTLSSKSYLLSLMAIIRGALESLHHAPNDYADQVPAIFGRPLALVNMGWSLELATKPLEDQSTHVGDDNVLLTGSQKLSALDYEFELKLGDKDNFNDGLIGYFAEKRDASNSGLLAQIDSEDCSFDFSTMFTDFVDFVDNDKAVKSASDLICSTSRPKFRPYFIDPTEASPDDYHYVQNQLFQVFCALVDPFSMISGYSAILPPKKLRLPQWAVNDALQDIAPFLRVGPVLVPGDLPDICLLQTAKLGEAEVVNGTLKPASVPAPVQTEEKAPPRVSVNKPTDDDWTWLQPALSSDDAEEPMYHEIELSSPGTKYQSLEGPHTAIEGHLQLRKVKQVIGTHDPASEHRCVSLGEFLGDKALILEMTGRGLSGGLPMEAVDVIICLRRDLSLNEAKGATYRTVREVTLNFAVVHRMGPPADQLHSPVNLPLDQPQMVSYTRPNSDYSIELSIFDAEFGIAFPIRRFIPVSATRADLLLAKICTFTVPPKVSSQAPFEGELIIRDRFENICAGYDDSGLLSFDGAVADPLVNFEGDHYRIKFPPFLDIGKKHISCALDDYPVGLGLPLTVTPCIDVARCIVRGSGLCTGQEGEQVEVEVLLCDINGVFFVNEGVEVKVIIGTKGNTPIKPTIAPVTPTLRDAHPYWKATFIRPESGTYEVEVSADAKQLSTSPLIVSSVREQFQRNPQTLIPRFGTARQNSISIEIFDGHNKRWFAPIPDTELVELRGTKVPLPATQQTFSLKLSTEFENGIYEFSAKDLTGNSEWVCELFIQSSSGRASFCKEIAGSLLIEDSGNVHECCSRVEQVYAGGKGLQTGQYNEQTSITVTCQDQGLRTIKPGEANFLGMIIVPGQAPTFCGYKDGTGLTYCRPTVGAKDYIVRVGVRFASGSFLEAAGSPFHVRAVTKEFFSDLPRSIQLMSAEAPKGYNQAALFSLLDQEKRKLFARQDIALSRRSQGDGQVFQFNSRQADQYPDLLGPHKIDQRFDGTYNLLYNAPPRKVSGKLDISKDVHLDIELPPTESWANMILPPKGFMIYKGQSSRHLVGRVHLPQNMVSHNILVSVYARLLEQSDSCVTAKIVNTTTSHKQPLCIEIGETLATSVREYNCRLDYGGFNIAETSVYQSEPTVLFPESSVTALNAAERDFIKKNFTTYVKKLCFSPPAGTGGTRFFVWAENLQKRPHAFPQGISLHHAVFNRRRVLMSLDVRFEGENLKMRAGPGYKYDSKLDEHHSLAANERIVKVSIFCGQQDDVKGIEFSTSQGKISKSRAEHLQGVKRANYPIPPGFWGLRGFWGMEGTCITRIGPIWGP